MLLYDSEAKADKQMLQLEEFIDMKVDGIIMSPVENSFSEASLNKLKSSGIPVILVDSDSSDSYFTCIVGPSSAQIGEAQAEYVAEKLDGNGTVLVFAGSPARKDSVARLTGFDNLIGKYPGIECIKIYDSLDMGTNLEQLQNTVKEHERIDGIVLQQNDISAQLIPFLRSLEYKPYIIGVDTTADILEVIKAGELDASIYINNSDIASGAYNTMIKIIQKEDVPRRKTIPHSLITTDNIDEFIQNNLNYKIK